MGIFLEQSYSLNRPVILTVEEKKGIAMGTPRVVHVIGGGTRQYIDGSHLYLGSKATGNTARRLAELCCEHSSSMDVELALTAMAGGDASLDTNEQLAQLVDQLVADPKTKIVFFTPSVLDYELVMEKDPSEGRLKTSHGERSAVLRPTEKLLERFRHGARGRKDIFLVACKQTAGASEAEMFTQALLMQKRTGANLVLANDAVSKINMIVTPEEATYCVTTDREAVLRELVAIAYLRSPLMFTQSTIVAGESVPWQSSDVPSTLRHVVDHCIAGNAYKLVNGVTAGHFAVKLSDTEFLTSKRRTNFNQLNSIGLVRVRTDGPDTVLAYGSKPSVGGQSQRIVFSDHPGMDCIVHFHCPQRDGSTVPIVSQREYECGSHECGQNTSRGLDEFTLTDGSVIKAVFLDNHGPNIVFHHSADPGLVIAFIEQHFNLGEKTGGYRLTPE